MSAYGVTTDKYPYYDVQENYNPASYDAGVYNDTFPGYPVNPGNQGKYRTLSNERWGSSLPNYKAIIASANNATTSFTGRRQTIEGGPATIEGRGTTVVGNYSYVYMRKAKRWWDVGGIVPPELASIPMTNAARNAAQTKFYKKYAEALTLFDSGTALGELRETLHMIRNPAKALRKGLDDYLNGIKKYRKGSPSSKQKSLAGSWLEYSFGWVPLLNDIDSAMGYLDKRQKQLCSKIIAIVGTGQDQDFAQSIVSVGPSNYLYLTGQRQRIRTVTVRYSGAIKSEITGSGNLNMSSLGLSPRSFVPTLWELIPYSFAVDYFTNIGEVLSAYSNGVAKLAWGCETIRKSSTLYAKSISGQCRHAEVLYQRVTSGGGRATNFEVTRSKITYVPLPDLQFEIPGLGTKWINLAALAATKRSLTPF